MNLYQILGVRPDATEEDIRKAYRSIARETHPDAHPDDTSAEQRFKEATAAYEVLSDTARRSVYDRERHPSRCVQDLLDKSVGSGLLSAMLPHAPAARRDGEDLIVCCPVEDGQVHVEDPRDPQARTRIPMPRVHALARVADMGSPGVGGGSPGALYVIPQKKEKP